MTTYHLNASDLITLRVSTVQSTTAGTILQQQINTGEFPGPVGTLNDYTVQTSVGPDNNVDLPDQNSTIAGAHDTLIGGAGRDWLQANQGNNRLVAGAGLNTLQGGSGLDTLLGGGQTSMLAGTGDTRMVAGRTLTAADTAIGGAGQDTM